MKKNTVHKTAPINRAGLTDIWNAFMVVNATFSPHDIPLCPTTAKKIPSKLIGYDEAKTIHKKNLRGKSDDYHVNAFIHFYIDDSKFDGKQSSFWRIYFTVRLRSHICMSIKWRRTAFALFWI